MWVEAPYMRILHVVKKREPAVVVKPPSNKKAKMVVLGLGLVIAVVAITVDAGSISPEFLTKLIELFMEIASSVPEETVTQ